MVYYKLFVLVVVIVSVTRSSTGVTESEVQRLTK